MSRSVFTHNESTKTVFRTCSAGYCPECEFGTHDDGNFTCPECGSILEPDGEATKWEFEGLVEDIRSAFKDRFPSMRDCNHWTDRESKAIVNNDLCMVVISEYCGLVSIGVVPTGDEGSYGYGDNTSGIAHAWTIKNAEPVLDIFSDLVKLGTFSNGESVYQRREA